MRRYLKPFDSRRIAEQRAAGMAIVSLENGVEAGGFGESIGADLRFGWPDRFVPHGSVPELERMFGLDAESVAKKISSVLGADGALARGKEALHG